MTVDISTGFLLYVIALGLINLAMAMIMYKAIFDELSRVGYVLRQLEVSVRVIGRIAERFRIEFLDKEPTQDRLALLLYTPPDRERANDKK